MKVWLAILLAACSPSLWAQLKWMPEDVPQVVFAGEGRKIQVTFSNPTDQTIEVQISTRLFQASSVTAVPLGPAQPWKRLRLLAGQTSLESAVVSFPAVKAGTRFLVVWLDEQGKRLGSTEVLVQPQGLAKELKTLAGDKTLGVFDPESQLKPILKALQVDFEDLEQIGWENFNGKLAIVGPLPLSPTQTPAATDLAGRIKSFAQAGSAVVWMQLPSGSPAHTEPPAYLIRVGEGTVVVTRSKAFSRLAGNPRAQFDLIHLASLALQPDRWESTLFAP